MLELESQIGCREDAGKPRGQPGSSDLDIQFRGPQVKYDAVLIVLLPSSDCSQSCDQWISRWFEVNCHIRHSL